MMKGIDYVKLVCGCLLILFTALSVGIGSFFVIKMLWVMILPPLFYIILTKSMRLGKVYLRCFVALAIAGLFVGDSVRVDGRLTPVLLALAGALLLFAVVTMLLKTRNKVAPVLLAVVVPLFILPLSLGLNPYAVTDASDASPLPTRRGVFIVKKTEKYNAYFSDTKYGLRDRLGLILPMEYDAMEILDSEGRFVQVTINRGKHKGVYDLDECRWVISPDYNTFYVTEIEKITDREFKLRNENRHYFATLILPDPFSSEKETSAQVEPHFYDDPVSIEKLIGIAWNAEKSCLLPSGNYYEELYDSASDAYEMMCIMLSMSDAGPSSPENDLNFAHAMQTLVKESKHYNGDVEKALAEVEKLGDSFSDTNGDMDELSELQLVVASTRVSLATDSLIDNSDDYTGSVMDEYKAWHNLTEAMTRYLDYLYIYDIVETSPRVSRNNQVKEWLDFRRKAVETDADIITGKCGYSIPAGKTFSTGADYDELFYWFYSDEYPDYYHPMWNEVRYTFNNLIEQRSKVAAELDPDKARAYEAHTKVFIDGLFAFINDLDLPGFRPAL